MATSPASPNYLIDQIIDTHKDKFEKGTLTKSGIMVTLKQTLPGGDYLQAHEKLMRAEAAKLSSGSYFLPLVPKRQ